MAAILTGVMMQGLAVVAQQESEESVVEAARQARAYKGPKAKHVYTNEDMPSVARTAPAATGTAGAKGAKPAAGAKSAANAGKKALASDLRRKYEDLNEKIANTQKEISLLQGEQKLRAEFFLSRNAAVQVQYRGQYNVETKKNSDDQDALNNKLADLKGQLATVRNKAEAAQIDLDAKPEEEPAEAPEAAPETAPAAAPAAPAQNPGQPGQGPAAQPQNPPQTQQP
jgi:hypothetical protein